MLTITSPAFAHEDMIPTKYTCDGEDINPPLYIDGVQEGAKSFVLIMDDPDAPMGTWVHWVVWNIDPGTRSIDENSVPQGAKLGMNDFNRLQYGGPCPPSGVHRYFFKLYALNTRLDLAEGASKEELEQAMKENIIDEAALMGSYTRG